MRRRPTKGVEKAGTARRWAVPLSSVALLAGVAAGSALAQAGQSPVAAGAASLLPRLGLVGDVVTMTATGVKGAGKTGGPGNIAIGSFTWGATGSTSGAPASGRGTVVGTSKPLVLKRLLDLTSPIFRQDCLEGKTIATVTVYVTPSKSSDGNGALNDSMTITLQRVHITDDDWSVGVGPPSEVLTLAYQSSSVSYFAAPKVVVPTTTTTTASTTTTTLALAPPPPPPPPPPPTTVLG
jgi:type VI protein secretion system component Hcp